MKNSATSRLPVTAFTIPPFAPEAVADAYAAFDRAADTWAATRGEIEDAEQAAKAAESAAIRGAVDAVKEGKTPRDVSAVREEHALKIAGLRSKLEAASIAVDERGNELAAAIEEHRDEWLEQLHTAAEAATARYLAALTEARAALEDLGPARGAPAWLVAFDRGRAIAGQQQQYAGGRVRAEGEPAGPLRGEQDPLKLLTIAGRIDVEKPAPRRHAVARR